MATTFTDHPLEAYTNPTWEGIVTDLIRVRAVNLFTARVVAGSVIVKQFYGFRTISRAYRWAEANKSHLPRKAGSTTIIPFNPDREVNPPTSKPTIVAGTLAVHSPNLFVAHATAGSAIQKTFLGPWATRRAVNWVKDTYNV